MNNKKSLIICISIYTIFLVYGINVNETFITGYKLLNVCAAVVSPALIYLFLRFINVKVTHHITFIIFGFNLLSIVMGNILRLYSLWDPYDKVLHCLSGCIIAVFAYLIYVGLTKKNRFETFSDCLVAVLFVNGINVFVAFLWELFEFLMLVCFGIDSIRHNSTGVYDMMLDTIVCVLGGFVVCFMLFAYYKSKNKNIIINMADTFLENNKLVKEN